jgi:nucleoside 2-deoxyribosyltransferase
MIYIAGAIDLRTQEDKQVEDPRDVAEKAITIASIPVYRPDHAIRCSNILVDRAARSIRALNYKAIEACDGMIAIVSSRMSVGTVMDMMYARDCGIPVVVVLHGIRRPSYLVDWPVFADVQNAVRALIGMLNAEAC